MSLTRKGEIGGSARLSMGGQRDGVKGIALGGVVRANGASRGGSGRLFQRRSNTPERKAGAASCGAAWREEEAPSRRRVGPGGAREVGWRSKRRRRQPVGKENHRRRRCQSSGEARGRRKIGEDLFVKFEKFRGLSVN
jgi:hypothetical protein